MWNQEIVMGLKKTDKEPTDIREMRKAIELASRDSVVIRRAFDTAYHWWLSGEDKYTLLAYHALQMLQEQYERNLEWLSVSTTPQTVILDQPKSR